MRLTCAVEMQLVASDVNKPAWRWVSRHGCGLGVYLFDKKNKQVEKAARFPYPPSTP